MDEKRGILEVADVEGGPNTLLHLEPDSLFTFLPKTVTSPYKGAFERQPTLLKGEVDLEIASRVEIPDRGLLLGVSGEVPEVLVAGLQDLVVRLRIPVGERPGEIVSDDRMTRAFVSVRGEDALAIMDLQSLQVRARLPVGHGPTRLLKLPGDEFLYCMNTDGDTVSVVRMEGPEVYRTLKVGGNPLGAVLWDSSSR
jgi:hypothetical protein